MVLHSHLDRMVRGVAAIKEWVISSRKATIRLGELLLEEATLMEVVLTTLKYREVVAVEVGMTVEVLEIEDTTEEMDMVKGMPKDLGIRKSSIKQNSEYTHSSFVNSPDYSFTQHKGQWAWASILQCCASGNKPKK